MPRIQLQRLVKRYGSLQVLHDINLEMEDNEFTVLVGPSGCGKSTTLRMIAGLETVSEGEIYIDGKPISNLPPKDRGLAMVFQDYALYPHMNVAQNMSFALRLQRVAPDIINDKVKEVSTMLGLSDYLDRKPAELSGGQRQRVAMGRALARDSDVFLFDEPLSNLDAKLRGQMREELALMHQRLNKNMIYVTHDQIEAMTLADRIVVMNGGYIQQQGTPKDLYENPTNKFVAGFLGSPPMNFLSGQLQGDGSGMAVVGDGFKIELSAEQAKRARAHHKKSVIVGIRPSHIVADKSTNELYRQIKTEDSVKHDSKPKAEAKMELGVVLSEYIGSVSVLLARTPAGQQPVHIEVKPETPVVMGQTMTFGVQQDKIHLFDTETEQTI